MAIGYDHSFAPYVIPTGVTLREGLLPEPRWAAQMALGQVQARVGALALRVEHGPRLLPGLRRRLARAIETLVPAAEGRAPTDGDAEFAWARLAGTNPFSLYRVDAIGELPVGLQLDTDTMANLTDGGPSLEARIAAQQVFVLRYDGLRVQNPTMMQRRKFVAPCTALFVHAPELQAPFTLVPLAIEAPTGRADGTTAVLTPLDGARWRAAKQLVAATDVNASELLVHLARTHYMTAPFAIALRRTVPKHHPLFNFLFPHLRFGLFVDRMAWQEGFRETAGILIRSLSGSAAWSREVAKSLWYDQSFREQHFERDLQARGLDDAPFEYAYRDDGRLLWSAIRRFVDGFVCQTWSDDDAVSSDSAVQALVTDVTDPLGGNVRGLLAGERLDTRDELTEILTQILFVAGPVHALTHYGSAAQLQDALSNPSWLTENPLSASHTATPGVLEAIAQYSRVISTNKRYDVLGNFDGLPFGEDPRYSDLIDAFQSELRDIEGEIQRRNQRRLAPFLHFMPSRIPNGITV